MEAAPPQPRALWPRLSLGLLVLVNLIPVYGVLALGWDVFPLVLLFWLENVVVGGFNILRLLFAQPDDGATWAAKFFFIPFFTVHYGIFTLVHGIFVFVLFSGKEDVGMGGPLDLLNATGSAVATWHLGLPLLALIGSHLVSFVVNYLIGGEYRRASLPQIMFRPYGRVVALHVAILIGGMLAMSLGSPIWALLLLIAVKIGFDVAAHVRSHTRPAEA